MSLVCAAALLGGGGWFVTQSVHSECDVAVSYFADSNGDPLPDKDGVVRSVDELAELAYWEKVRAGDCEPPAARWRQWFR
ncbi:hypothetical protein ACF09C_34495 [Streptomyces sp. NPDC014870]|uniref:hypothetical protein n=1 Tax=Streptomyces sp. NPDC014870 TaxID=3364925 RepID=UPI0036FE4605